MRAPAALAAGVAILASLGLGACTVHAPLALPDEARSSLELDATPFFPQEQHQCGPAALATLLGSTGVETTPEQLTPLVYIPGRRGSLQIEMLAAPRRFERIAYAIEPRLDSIIAELNARRVVLILHNYGLPVWPRWHYAVVIGYDAARNELLMRSGRTRRQSISVRKFMRAWSLADRWALVALRPGELPDPDDRARYLEAAAAFERSAAPAMAGTGFEAAIRVWPDDPVAWIGRGTASYRQGQFEAAARDYREALRLDPTQAGARNNLAMALLELGCPARARAEAARIDRHSLAAPLLQAVQDTLARVDAAGSAARDGPNCGN